ncbi:MAG: imelysin family protein, partial [Pseudomonadota bacterium]
MIALRLLAPLAIATAFVTSPSTSPRAEPPKPAAVIAHYADIAEAMYTDALTTARALDASISALISKPSEARMAAARKAWFAARVPYQQTEAFRFGNAIVDDWEGRVNAWPLDEGLIDYVSTAQYGEESFENDLFTANVIANRSLQINGVRVDIPRITPKVIEETLHEAGDIEANVASGYHAIEFLLWGQDLNGTGPGAGTRPASDYDPAACTNGNCDRRAQYLAAASALLISDLEWIVAQWTDNGAARKALVEAPQSDALIAIFTGLGSLSYGELAGERMKLGLLLHDPEEEHDCFADNTHNSHLYNQVGMWGIYSGTYARVDGTSLSGPSVSDLVRAARPDVDARASEAFRATLAAMRTMAARAESG